MSCHMRLCLAAAPAPTHIQRCVFCGVLPATVNGKTFHATHGACVSHHTAVHPCCKRCGRGMGAFILVYFLTLQEWAIKHSLSAERGGPSRLLELELDGLDEGLRHELGGLLAQLHGALGRCHLFLGAPRFTTLHSQPTQMLHMPCWHASESACVHSAMLLDCGDLNR